MPHISLCLISSHGAKIADVMQEEIILYMMYEDDITDYEFWQEASGWMM